MVRRTAQPAASEPLSVEVLKISSEAPERYIVDYAAGFIKRGRVVGIPTDTFYALCADPFNLAAIERVFQVKGRAEDKALPILVDSVEQCRKLGELQHAPEEASRAVEIGAFCARPVAYDRDGITMADFTGLGVEDLFIAEACHVRLAAKP